MRKHPRVLMVGSAEQSAGGVASVIRTMKQMPVWEEFRCGWLGTQIQRNHWWKVWYAIKEYFIALFTLWRYDIIHFHTVPDRICLIIQLPVFLLARLWRKKIVIQIHMGNQLAEHKDNKLFLWHLKRASLIILLARKWQQNFKEWFPTIHVPTKVVYNACVSVNEVKQEEKQKLIIMAAYLNDNKAPGLLLKAWKRIHAKYPDWRVAILGNGEVERFKKMSDDMSLSESVTFTGYITGKTKEDFFRAASIYCMCSYEEGFPMVALEAWAYGMCLVTTPVGGLPDVLEEDGNALVFNFGDVGGLTGCLEKLITSDDKRRQMAGHSRNFVYEHFSKEIICKKWEKIYACLS